MKLRREDQYEKEMDGSSISDSDVFRRRNDGSVSGSIGGVEFTAYSSIYAGGADAGTVSSGTHVSMSVSADYSYVNTISLKTGTSHQSMDRVTGAVVTFAAPGGCRSVRITASHSASSGSEHWSGSTSATY